MLILASASKARKSLLEQLSIEHVVMPSYIDETKFFNKDVKELVQCISLAKAKSIVSKILFKEDNEYDYNPKITAILGCDSLFECDGHIFGKPKDFDEAIRRWKMMSSKSGVIHTGHSLMYREKNNMDLRGEDFKNIVVDVISTKINFSKLTDLEIVKYVNTQEPMGCAGGFSIEGKGSLLIESIEGCYTNVLGLSLPWLKKALEQANIYLLS